MNILICGGAGFIGSAFVGLTMERYPDARVTVLDALTYAGNPANLARYRENPRFHFIHGTICDPEIVQHAMEECTWVVNFAAETHVDRSILDSGAFVRTDVEGTRVLLEAARDLGVERYLQVSTDEVYGHIPAPRRARESDGLHPRSPYAASKAAGDLMVGAYHATFDLPVLITRGSNTYGPHQYPEKLVPLVVTNALDGLPIPVYGDGLQMRDWLFVTDHCTGIMAVLERGTVGEVYNIGVGRERQNLEVVERIVRLVGCDPALIRHVPDRPGHDGRYALDTAKINALGWVPTVQFEQGLAETVRWYAENRWWWEPLKDGEYAAYYLSQYAERLGHG